MKRTIVFGFVVFLHSMMCACADSEELDVRPREKGNIVFTLQADFLGAPLQTYTLTEYTAIATGSTLFSGGTVYDFIVMGRDSLMNVDMVISMNSVSGEQRLNVAIDSLFYKDCNQNIMSVQPGEDERGAFITVTPFSSCMTSILASERRILTDSTFQYSLSGVKLYLTEQ